MDATARRALGIIRRCLDSGRYRLLEHFRQRMAERGLIWGDVLAVVDDPLDLRPDGDDDFGRPRWILSGVAVDGLPVELVSVLDRDKQGKVTVFITLYLRTQR